VHGAAAVDAELVPVAPAGLGGRRGAVEADVGRRVVERLPADPQQVEAGVVEIHVGLVEAAVQAVVVGVLERGERGIFPGTPIQVLGHPAQDVPRVRVVFGVADLRAEQRVDVVVVVAAAPAADVAARQRAVDRERAGRRRLLVGRLRPLGLGERLAAAVGHRVVHGLLRRFLLRIRLRGRRVHDLRRHLPALRPILLRGRLAGRRAHRLVEGVVRGARADGGAHQRRQRGPAQGTASSRCEAQHGNALGNVTACSYATFPLASAKLVPRAALLE
jgi:hypothetical protein